LKRYTKGEQMPTSKQAILSKLPSSKPPKLEYDIKATFHSNPLEVFETNLKLAGGDIVYQEDIVSYYQDRFANIVDTTKDIDIPSSKEFMDKVELLILESSLGVAENGAVWIEATFPRALITTTKHIAIKLSSKDIVSNMHQAYERLDSTNLSCGMFLSGPSKTADIEQALVIGAHGALVLDVFIA